MPEIGIDTQGLVDPPDREHLKGCVLYEDSLGINTFIDPLECICLDLLYDVQADAADAARDEGLLYD